MVDRGKVGIHKPNPKYLKVLTVTTSTTIILPEPSCYKEYKGIPKYEVVMRKNYETIIKNHTWELALFPLARRLKMYGGN